MRKSLVLTACMLCLSLVAGALVLTAPSAAFTIGATVDIHPETLNLKSNGTWITVLIGPPEGHEVSDINVTTVRLGTVPAAWGNVGENKLMVKFDRQAVIDYVISKLYHIAPPPAKNYVELTITGELFDGTPFEGKDTIRVVYEG